LLAIAEEQRLPSRLTERYREQAHSYSKAYALSLSG
jgi:hypothetical protein